VRFFYFSRRRFLAGCAALCAAALAQGERPAAVAGAWDLFATTIWDDGVNIRSGPGGDFDLVAEFGPGTTVQVLDGPNEEGWYYVISADDRVTGEGWIAGWLLIFEQRVLALEDVPLLEIPGDPFSTFAWLRHGFVATQIGPAVSDSILLRSGEWVGYATIRSLVPTVEEETDRDSEWWVDVDRTAAIVQLMVGAAVVDRFDASVSRDDGEGFYATAIGTFWIYQKIEELTYTPFADAYFRYWAGFDPERFNGLHSWTMDAAGHVLDGGWGTTAGCVATAPQDAAVIFDFVDLGTRVEIHW